MVYRALDPVQDASLYLADTEAVGLMKEVLPKCGWCDEEMAKDDECYEIDGMYFCEECMRRMYGLKVRDLISYE